MGRGQFGERNEDFKDELWSKLGKDFVCRTKNVGLRNLHIGDMLEGVEKPVLC